MNIHGTSPLRIALIRECATEFAAPLAHLLDIARVYGHSLHCEECRRFTPSIEGYLADAARRVGDVVRSWNPIGVEIEDVFESDSPELALLLAACRSAPHFSDNDSAPQQPRIDWQMALGLAGLAFSLRAGPGTRHIQMR